MTDPIDRELQAAFDELRAADAASAPAFSSLANNPVPIVRRSVAARVVWAAIAAGVLIVAATVVLRARRAPAPDAEPLDITQWKAPTDILLEMSRESIAPKDFNASVLNSFQGL
jgi:hypothetical protein